MIRPGAPGTAGDAYRVPAREATDDVAGRLAIELAKVEPTFRHATIAAKAIAPFVVDLMRQRAAEELEAAYWATAAILDPEAVREVVRERTAALRGDGR